MPSWILFLAVRLPPQDSKSNEEDRWGMKPKMMEVSLYLSSVK